MKRNETMTNTTSTKHPKTTTPSLSSSIPLSSTEGNSSVVGKHDVSEKTALSSTSVHANVLGRDGNDNPVNVFPSRNVTVSARADANDAGIHTANSVGMTTLHSSSMIKAKTALARKNASVHGFNGTDHLGNAEGKPKWWGNLWQGGKSFNIDGNNGNHSDDEDETSSQYQCLEAPTHHENDIDNRRRRGVALISSAASMSTETVEDRLKQDCSFFYQGIEDTPSPSNLIRNQQRGINNTIQGLSSLPSMFDQSRFLSSRAGNRFRAEYEKLNQELALSEVDDLFLDEEEHGIVGRRIFSSASATSRSQGEEVMIDFSNTARTSQKLSTLFFEQDGRVLMKLPRDQIRLMMDQDLKPGILSVEQCRPPTSNDINNQDYILHGNTDYCYDTGRDEGEMEVLEEGGRTFLMKKPHSTQPPPLRYVMTVPDDLYRRIVAEMSYALMPPWWGCFMCCNETDGRADIKLALAILSITLFLIFISTMEWPTD